MIQLYRLEDLTPDQILNRDLRAEKDVEAVESWLNRYPRQLLGWASAGQLFEGYLQTV